ncbi:HAD family hydrolase [Jeotgalibacillus aurantiacus]|uniref:HAD family hydrolase n=1 Tax=Jeotgalibacillus aurantiacus TaxID=2763266 RepID=UPI001D0BB975|nr:HAD hydrolase-like protein [Jeotgalibacillus aurantiacus]
MALILFDLDGTLVDSSDHLIEALHLALEDMPHLEDPSIETVRSAYGLTGNDFWAKVVPEASPQEVTIIRKRRSMFLNQLVKGKNILFPGVRETLQTLKDQGHVLSTASNCGTHYLDMVLDSQNIREYFTNPICLGTINGEKKADILEVHFDHFEEEEAIMVGDRYSDIEAARAHNIPVVACTYGFGQPDEWEKADYQVDRIEKIPEILAR